MSHTITIFVLSTIFGIFEIKSFTDSYKYTKIQTCGDGICEYMTVVESKDKKEAARQLMAIYHKILPVYNAMRNQIGFTDPGPLKPSDLLESDGFRTNDKKTTYTIHKSSVHVCLREKSGGLYSDDEIKFNRIIYVVLHEITHRLTLSWDHTDEFWRNFSKVIKEAVRQGCYIPEDFSKSTWTHCGKNIVNVGGL